MRTIVSVLTVAVALLAALVLLVPGAAQAVGTPAGTVISNNATLDFQVGGVSQPTVTSVADTFKVDAKVDFTIAANSDGVSNSVASGGASDTYWIAFDVTNVGNVGLDLGFGTTYPGGNDWDQNVLKIVLDVNDNDIYESAIDTDTFIDEWPVGNVNSVFVVAQAIPARADGDISNITLTVTAYYNGGAGQGALVVADTGGDNDSGPNGIDWVRADTGNDGLEAATDAFLVSGATLTVTKSSTVIWDPINISTNPIAIPGARISFTITVTHTAGSTATEITITDQMPANVTYSSDGITVINSGGAPGGTFGLSNGGGAGGCPEVGNACGWFDGADTVIVNGITLDLNEVTEMIFNATID